LIWNGRKGKLWHLDLNLEWKYLADVVSNYQRRLVDAGLAVGADFLPMCRKPEVSIPSYSVLKLKLTIAYRL